MRIVRPNRLPPALRRAYGTLSPFLDPAVLILLSVATAALYLDMHHHLGPSEAPPLESFRGNHRIPLPDVGWWSWWDQSAYIQAALAWANGVLDPPFHWYLPGYPLLAAPFVRITPAQPFMVPNLLCYLGSLWIFASLAARLLPDLRHGRAVGALLFFGTSVLPHKALWSWVVPWTTTPETLCLLACLLAAARFLETRAPADAFLPALAGVAVAGFRPADAAAVLAVVTAVGASAILRRPGRAPVAPVVLAALAGALIPALAFGGAYLAVMGWAPSEYLILSQAIGFEWRLLPVRWITLVLDPKPLFSEGRGLAAVFPWIAPGIVGMAVCLVRPRSVPRRLHLVIAGATLLNGALYLAYRDLHETALWRLGNFHYFKWMLPVLGLYAVLLLRALLRPDLPALATAVGAASALFLWRVELTDPVALPAADNQAVTIPDGLAPINRALIIRTNPNPGAFFGWGGTLDAGGRSFSSFYDLKMSLWAGQMMVTPLRPLPASPSVLQVSLGVTPDASAPPFAAMRTPVWGLPCWIARDRPGCRTRFPFPAAVLPRDTPVAFGAGGGADAYLVAGWAGPEPNGRWTDLPEARLRFGLPDAGTGGRHALEITARRYGPRPAIPTRVALALEGGPTVKWRLLGDGPDTFRLALPRGGGATGDRSLTLRLTIENPRRRIAETGGPDTRELGIFVETIRLVALPDP